MIGQTIFQYRILEQLGGGGMGLVYRAHDTRLDRSVALKFLPRGWSQEKEFRERFDREARAAARDDARPMAGSTNGRNSARNSPAASTTAAAPTTVTGAGPSSTARTTPFAASPSFAAAGLRRYTFITQINADTHSTSAAGM